MRSILQNRDNWSRCYICGAEGTQLDEHHVFGGGLRKLSERYGLKVHICHERCHLYGKYAVHRDAATDRTLKRIAQREAMRRYHWTMDDWHAIWGKSYIGGEEDGL